MKSKKNVLIFYLVLTISACKFQTTEEKLEIKKQRKAESEAKAVQAQLNIAKDCAFKYLPHIKEFQKYMYETYFKSMDVSKLKLDNTCTKQGGFVSYNINLDSITQARIPFSEKVMYVKLYCQRLKYPENVMWCSDMSNPCLAELNFLKAHTDSGRIGENMIGIGERLSAGIIKGKNEEQIICISNGIVFKEDSPLPFCLVIYLKKR